MEETLLVHHLDQVVAEAQVQLEDLLLVVKLVEQVAAVPVQLQEAIMEQQEQLILVVAVEVLGIILEVTVVQELLLLDTNFKINMYLLNFKINI